MHKKPQKHQCPCWGKNISFQWRDSKLLFVALEVLSQWHLTPCAGQLCFCFRL